MALKDITNGIPALAKELLSIPFERVWSSYDKEADVLYLTFKRPSHADDTELTDDDILIRYEKGEVVGITILNASKRNCFEKPPHHKGTGDYTKERRKCLTKKSISEVVNQLKHARKRKK